MIRELSDRQRAGKGKVKEDNSDIIDVDAEAEDSTNANNMKIAHDASNPNNAGNVNDNMEPDRYISNWILIST